MFINYLFIFSSCRCLGGRQSSNARQRERLSSSFETIQEATERVSDEMNKERSGQKKKVSHAYEYKGTEWDKESLKLEIKELPDGYKVNWSELARKYNVTTTTGRIAKNRGQVVKDWLISENIDISRFSQKRKVLDNEEGERVVRRKKLKGLGGEISIPVAETNDSIKKRITEQIRNGEYNVGEQITPRRYDKLVLENGKIVKKQFTVEGRKQLLIDIRKHTMILHEKYMRLRIDSFYDDFTLQSASQLLKDLNEFKEGDSLDEMKMRLKKMERTRHITMWHDASTLANHGHVVFTVNMLYDKAAFYTNEEYKANTGRNISVQTEIEKPIVYIVARCRANDEQLAYVQTRIDCTNRLSVKLDTESGIQFTGKLRFFKGDSPAV